MKQHSDLVFKRLPHFISCRTIQVFLLSIALVFCLVLYTTFRSDDFEVEATAVAFEKLNDPNRIRTVLFWTTWFDKPFGKMWNGKSGNAFLSKCPDEEVFKKCVITDDRSRLTEADAVVFHTPDMINVANPFGGHDVPYFRHPNQRYIFYNMESPVHTLVRFVNNFPSLSSLHLDLLFLLMFTILDWTIMIISSTGP